MIRVGLDFDNTIVGYDALFCRVAEEQGLVKKGACRTKTEVRDRLRAAGREPLWTEMQGYVYGVRMDEAAPMPGVIDALAEAEDLGIEISIVSHKTRHPFIGPPHDLHRTAEAWIARHLVRTGRPLVPAARIHFELTKDEKLARIAAQEFAAYVDDLPEILAAPQFPARTLAVLYDPAGAADLPHGAVRVRDWTEILPLLRERCRTTG